MRLPHAAHALTTLAIALATTVAAQAASDDLIAAARREGTVNWYTTLIVDQLARPIAGAFEAKYGIKVNFIRSGEAEIALRLFNESKAGKIQGDIYDSVNASNALRRENMLLKWRPDSAAGFPAEFQDPEGYWTPMSLYIGVPGYNSDMVKAADAPRAFEDLLDPRWKDKLSWNTDGGATGAPGFVGAALIEMGAEKGMDYLKKLAAQNVTGVPGGARHLFDMVISGEYPMALQMLSHHAYFSASHGAPAGWAPVQGSMAFFIVLDLVAGSPHPNAGKLLEDFIVSPEGQTIFRDVGYIPIRPDMAPRDPALKPDGKTFRVHYLTPQQVDDGVPKWSDIYRDIFR